MYFTIKFEIELNVKYFFLFYFWQTNIILTLPNVHINEMKGKNTSSENLCLFLTKLKDKAINQ